MTMASLLAVVLSPGAKGFFEDPAWLLGLPLLLLGLAGIALAMSPVELLRWPEPSTYVEPELVEPEEGHPDAATYIKIGAVLFVITMVEVIVYYIDALSGALLAILIVLSASKFALVVLWFMHLRFDNRLFSIFFAGAMALAAALFVVVLASLGASLV
jgi:caa(3)-type oxidase subunit IV